MSKIIKQMEMTTLENTFKGVRDLVALKIVGLGGTATTTFRAAMRKKKIRIHVVKNSLARKVFTDLGLNLKTEATYWTGPTAFAFGGDSAAGLAKAIDGELKGAKTAPIYKDKVIVKGGVAEGQETPFDVMLKMPTRAEAIGAIISALLGPGGAIAGCLIGPAAQVASQIKTISEREPPAEAAPPAETAAPAAEAAPAPSAS